MSKPSVSCIILAGGEGKRVNRADKGLIELRGQPLVAHVINAIQHQVDDIVISANRNLELYRQFSSNVIPDTSGQHGPLSGIAAALPVCRHEQVLVVPCDMPYLPENLLVTLQTHIEQHDITIADVQHHLQLVFLMRKLLLPSVQEHISTGKHKLMQWVKSCSHTTVDFSANADAFKNINSINELNQI